MSGLTPPGLTDYNIILDPVSCQATLPLGLQVNKGWYLTVNINGIDHFIKRKQQPYNLVFDGRTTPPLLKQDTYPVAITASKEGEFPEIYYINVHVIYPPVAKCQLTTNAQLDSFGNVTVTPAMVNNGSQIACYEVPYTDDLVFNLYQTDFSCADIINNPNQSLFVVTDTLTGLTDTCVANITINMASVVSQIEVCTELDLDYFRDNEIEYLMGGTDYTVTFWKDSSCIEQVLDTITESGTYYVNIVKSVPNCSQKFPFQVTIKKLTVEKETIKALEGEQVTLNATGDTGIVWSGTVENGVPFVSPVGVYKYFVTSDCGVEQCAIVNVAPKIGLTLKAKIKCGYLYFKLTATGGFEPYNYQINELENLSGKFKLKETCHLKIKITDECDNHVEARLHYYSDCHSLKWHGRNYHLKSKYTTIVLYRESEATYNSEPVEVPFP